MMLLKTNVDFMEAEYPYESSFYGVVTGKYFENGEMYSGYSYNAIRQIGSCYSYADQSS